MSLLRRMIVVVGAALLVTIGASAASAASLGTVVVDYSQYPTWAVTPSSLTGVAGDTFVLQNNRNNDNGPSYISLVNDTGSVTKGGTSCTADASCTVLDSTGAPNTGTFTVVTPGTLSVRRSLSGGAATTIGTLTIVDGNPPPTPAPSTVSVTGVSPASGLTTGGEAITITGAGFAAGATVTIGGQPATAVTVASNTALTATTPAHMAGVADVTVTVGSDNGTKAGAYTYKQGYWLSVTNTQPAGAGPNTDVSTGAVRSTEFGDWAATRHDRYTEHIAYIGGINCGNRTVKTDIFFFLRWGDTWAGGPCRYAFPAGTVVALSALPSSYTGFPLLGLGFVGIFNKWTGACSGTAVGCTVQMTADRDTRATWGRTTFGLGAGAEGRGELSSGVATPVFAADGSVTYAVFTIRATIIMGADDQPAFVFSSTFDPAVKASSERAASQNAARRVVGCKGSARRLDAHHLTAVCRPTPALAAALRKGSVPLITKWSLVVPRQHSTTVMGATRSVLRNRHVSGAVTG